MLTSAAAFLALTFVPTQAPQRPVDMWAFRSVLDKRARMFTLALHKDLYVAYDATNCGLYRAWKGGVKFDGAVYTTVHGPQPTSFGDIYVPGILDEQVWFVREGSSNLKVKPEFKGYKLENGQATLQYRLKLNPEREIWVYETPEYVATPTPRFKRNFRVVGVLPSEQIVLHTAGQVSNPIEFSGVPFYGKLNPAPTDQKVFVGIARSGSEISVNLNSRPGTESELVAEELFEESAPIVQQGPREPGLAMRVYWIDQDMAQIPKLLAGQSPNYSVVIPKVDLSGPKSFGDFSDKFYVHVTGFLNIKEAGDYEFRISSDDGSQLRIRDEVIIDHDGLHSADPKDGKFRLSPGEHPIEIEMFEQSGDEVLKLEWKTPGSREFVVIPPSAFTTPQGEVRVTAPGKKGIADPAKRWRPGDGLPLAGVHPGLKLSTVRPKDFKPRVGGIDFLPDGRIVICTWDADGAVYIIDGHRSKNPADIKVKKIAQGLAEPLGLKVVDGQIYVLQKQELTLLKDNNKDEIIDEYFTVANGWGVTANFHEFAFGLTYDKGFFYATLAIAIDPGGRSTQPQNPDRGAVVKISKDKGTYELVARGLRTPNGIGWGAKGRMYVADNQGDWLPSSKILPVAEGAFYGSRAVDPVGDVNRQVTLPVVWLPQGEIGNSPSQIAPLNFGPYKDQMVHGDVTHGGLKRVFVEEVDGVLQGVVFRFTQGLEAGINRVIPDGKNGFIVGGIGSTGNWGQDGKERFGLQRLTFNGQIAFEMLAVRAFKNGMEIEFTKPIQKGLGDELGDFRVEQWRYVPTATYGGPKVNTERLSVKSLTYSGDRKKVFLELDGMKADHVVYVKVARGLAPAGSDELLWSTEAWYTLNRIPAKVYATKPAPTKTHNTLSGLERGQGFELLFDGKSLGNFVGWKKGSVPRGWSAKGGELIFTPGVEGGDLRTKVEYENFELRLEWKISRGGNSGIMFRATEDKTYPWETAPEMQVLDDDLHPDGRTLATSAGSNYALHSRSRDMIRPAGEWNEVRLIVKGNHVEHWVNGWKIVSYELGSKEWTELVSKSKFATMPDYGKRKKGFIVLQDHGDVVSYRSIRIRKL